MPGFSFDDDIIYPDTLFGSDRLMAGRVQSHAQRGPFLSHNSGGSNGSNLVHCDINNVNTTPLTILDFAIPYPTRVCTILYAGEIDGNVSPLSPGFGGSVVVTTLTTTDFSYGSHTWRLTLASNTLKIHRTAGSFQTLFNFLILFI